MEKESCGPIEKPKPRTCVQLSADEVSGVGMGEQVEVTLKGTVVGISKDSWVDGKKNIRLEIEDYSVSIESNEADKDLKEMTGEDD